MKLRVVTFIGPAIKNERCLTNYKGGEIESVSPLKSFVCSVFSPHRSFMKESAIYVDAKGPGGMTALRLAACCGAAMVSDRFLEIPLSNKE